MGKWFGYPALRNQQPQAEKYFHDEVSMQENELPRTESKYENYKREQTFLENIVEFRSAEVNGFANI